MRGCALGGLVHSQRGMASYVASAMAKKPKSPPRRNVSTAHLADHPAAGIVSSAHLANNPIGALSQLEFALSMVVNAYSRWMVRCIEASIRYTPGIGRADLGALDVLVLHHVNHQDRSKRLLDIANVLNIDDLHTVNYALKKLVRLGLIEGERQGKEVFYSTTVRGHSLCDQYRSVREQCLIESLTHLGNPNDAISNAASLLRGLSGAYDQAARAAASL
jgi:predicted MarR family transcription regulator